MNTLNVENKIVAFGDSTVSSNPKLRYVDWSRSSLGLQVMAPKTESRYLAVGESWTVFNGTRTTSLDNTSGFDLTMSPLDPSRYRLTWTGVGTAPAFRADRALAFNTLDVTVTANANGTAKFVVASGAFTGVQVGDNVFIPSDTTGDAVSVFNALNVGWWQVLAVPASDTIVCSRLAGAVFEAVTETVTVVTDPQIQAFSSTGVIAGDKMSITGGFVVSTQKTFTVVAATPVWVEITSTTPLPEESGIVTGSIFFYAHAKAFLHVECDQEATIKMNSQYNQTDTSIWISPIAAGDIDRMGWFQKYGMTWALTVVNQSGSGMNVNVITCE